MKRLSESACDRSLTQIREHSSKAPYIHFFSLYSKENVWQVRAHGKRCYTKQVAFAASAEHLPTLGTMSEGQRVSGLLKGLTVREKSQDITLSSKFDNMQVFSTKREQSLHLKFHDSDTASW